MLQGYYSLIQYCPDFTRLEVCNIGVMLYCPEKKFLDVEMTTKLSRIQAIFGKKHKPDYVRMFQASFADRIRAERDFITNSDELKRFIARRANDFQITEPRSIAVTDPQQELQGLFTEIFGENTKSKEKNHTHKEMFYQALEQQFGNELEKRVLTKCPRIQIHDFRKTIRPCACYLNGVFNIVVQEQLKPNDYFDKLSCDMVTGKILADQEDAILGPRRLVILADTGNDSEILKHVRAFQPILKENKVEICTDLDTMVTTIKNEAKILTDNFRQWGS